MPPQGAEGSSGMRPHFLQKKTVSPAASSRTVYPSPPAKAEVSLTPSLVLSPQSLMALWGPRLPIHSNERRDGVQVIVHKRDIALRSIFPDHGMTGHGAMTTTGHRASSPRRSCSASDSEAETTAAVQRLPRFSLGSYPVSFLKRNGVSW